MDEYRDIAEEMPLWLRDALLSVDRETMNEAAEIRMRAGCPVLISLPKGRKPHTLGRILSCEEIRQVLNHLCGYSVYLRTGELEKGYITLKGGHRMAVCGRRAEMTSGGIADVTSLCIRIARQINGCGRAVANAALASSKGVLVLGEPGSGKTTVIRDAARIMALGRYSVAIVDEKNELAPPLVREGGIAADILSGYSKAEAVGLAVQLLSPDFIIMDEITHRDELDAIERAVASGIRFVVSAHGRALSSAVPAAKKAAELLGTAAILEGKHNPGEIKELVSL